MAFASFDQTFQIWKCASSKWKSKSPSVVAGWGGMIETIWGIMPILFQCFPPFLHIFIFQAQFFFALPFTCVRWTNQLTLLSATLSMRSRLLFFCFFLFSARCILCVLLSFMISFSCWFSMGFYHRRFFLRLSLSVCGQIHLLSCCSRTNYNPK